MTSLATAAKAKLEIKDDRGQSWWLSPIELADMASLEQKLAVAPFERAAKQMDALGEHLTPATEKMIVERAQAEADDCKFMSPNFVTHLSSVQGVSYMLFMSLRKNHPDITEDEASHLVTLENVEAWQERLDRVSGVAEDDDSDPTQEPVTESPPDQPTGEPSIE